MICKWCVLVFGVSPCFCLEIFSSRSSVLTSCLELFSSWSSVLTQSQMIHDAARKGLLLKGKAMHFTLVRGLTCCIVNPIEPPPSSLPPCLSCRERHPNSDGTMVPFNILTDGAIVVCRMAARWLQLCLLPAKPMEADFRQV